VELVAPLDLRQLGLQGVLMFNLAPRVQLVPMGWVVRPGALREACGPTPRGRHLGLVWLHAAGGYSPWLSGTLTVAVAVVVLPQSSLTR
jgi:hypothetical protein